MNFLRLELARGHRLPHQPIAILATERFVIFLNRSSTTVWTFGVDRRVIALDRFTPEIANLFHDFACQVADVFHEMFSIEFSMSHLFETRLPFSGHFRSA